MVADKFLKNVKPIETVVNYQLGFKEITVRSEFDDRTVDLTVTNYPEHKFDGVDTMIDGKILIRFWENDKAANVGLPTDYLGELMEQTKLTEQEKTNFLNARFNSMLGWYIKSTK